MGFAIFIPIFCCLLIVGNVRPEVLSHSQALAMVQDAGITVTSTGGCSNRQNSQCTSLEGIHREAIDGIITLKRASGCPIIITGGTETGHGDYPGRSHKNGWKIDIRKRGEDCVTRYIKSNFAKISATRWRAPSGNIYYNEVNHWDIQYGNRAKRDVFATESEVDDNSASDEQHNDLAKRWAQPQQEEDGDEQINSWMDAILPNTNDFMKEMELEQINEEFGLNRNRTKRSATDDCLQCICQVESGCRPLPCKWDVNSLSCGYFQIKKEYYIDCYKPGHRSGESVETAWKRCAADYTCSAQCIKNYVNRYGFKCGGGVGPCQKMSRLHNGGPSGCSKSATNRYWNRVYNCLP